MPSLEFLEMKEATDVFDEWAIKGRDLGMEKGHAASVDEMLAFSLGERTEIGKNFSFLDLGCGNGWATRKVYGHPLCSEALGIDGANKMIRNAEARSKGELYIHTQVDTYKPTDTFDLIHSMEFIYYLTDPRFFVQRITDSWLNEGGRIIFGLDFYFENTESHTWPKKLNIPMYMMKEIEWINLFHETGLRDVTSWRVRKTPDCPGTLVLTGRK